MAFYQNNTFLFEVLSIIAVLVLSMNGAAGMVQWEELLFRSPPGIKMSQLPALFYCSECFQ